MPSKPLAGKATNRAASCSIKPNSSWYELLFRGVIRTKVRIIRKLWIPLRPINFRHDETIDTQRAQPKFAGTARYARLRDAAFRGFSRSLAGALSVLHVGLSAVQSRGGVDRCHPAGRRYVRWCGAQCRRIYPHVGGSARCSVGCRGACRRGTHLVDSRTRGIPPHFVVGAVAAGSVMGFGLDSYRLGVEALAEIVGGAPAVETE